MLEERERVTLSDNAIDLVPGDEQVVQVSGLSATSPALKYHYLDL
jgi:beta-mannosidase